jgi:hypothetical protein
MEAIWVAAEMRAGGAYAHSIIALNAINGSATYGSADAGAAHGAHGGALHDSSAAHS